MSSLSPLEKYMRKYEKDFLKDLIAWLRIPSISKLPEYVGSVREAAEYAAQQLKLIGFEVEIITTKKHPLLYAEWMHAPGKRTVLFYGHFDVQPVDPLEEWKTPPFEPTVIGEDIIARGGSDDKCQMMLIIKALQSLMAVYGQLPVNIKFLMEGEEEVGSESAIEFCRNNAARLACDVVVPCDTGWPSRDIPALITGLRGSAAAEVEVVGAGRDLHSGLFGGIAPTPIEELSYLIHQLKDEQGHIRIPAFYDQVWQGTPEERAFWRDDPLGLEKLLCKEMGISQLVGDPAYPPLQRLWHCPDLVVIGIEGGFTGEGVKGTIPNIARAKISLRLSPLQPAEEAYRLFEAAVLREARAPYQVYVRKIAPCTDGVMVPTDNPYVVTAKAAYKEVFKKETALLGRGSSIHIIGEFAKALKVPIVMIGFSLPDDRIHAPNEKYNLGLFKRGMRVVACFLQKLADL